jgi:hypothetical protein
MGGTSVIEDAAAAGVSGGGRIGHLRLRDRLAQLF